MPIDLDARLVETAQKITVSRNEYGDTVYGTPVSTVCLYRDNTSLNHVANREDVQYDGLLWFAASEVVNLGDIFNHETEGYLRIERVIRAKRLLLDNSRQFIKCMVSRQRQIS